MANKGPFFSGSDRVSYKFHTVVMTIEEAKIAAQILRNWAANNFEDYPYDVEVLGRSLNNAVKTYEERRY